MNRKEFFKKLGLGALVVAVTPKALAKEDESHLFTQSRGNGHILSYKDAQLIADEDLKARMQYPLTPKECYYSYDNNLEFWHDFGYLKGKHMQIPRNGFYGIGDTFRANNDWWMIKSFDKNYYYAYPI